MSRNQSRRRDILSSASKSTFERVKFVTITKRN